MKYEDIILDISKGFRDCFSRCTTEEELISFNEYLGVDIDKLRDAFDNSSYHGNTYKNRMYKNLIRLYYIIVFYLDRLKEINDTDDFSEMTKNINLLQEINGEILYVCGEIDRVESELRGANPFDYQFMPYTETLAIIKSNIGYITSMWMSEQHCGEVERAFVYLGCFELFTRLNYLCILVSVAIIK